MPRFKVPFEITNGCVEIAADDAKHANELLGRMTLNQLSSWGELDVGDPEEIPRDVEGELADKHWDRMKEDTL